MIRRGLAGAALAVLTVALAAENRAPRWTAPAPDPSRHPYNVILVSLDTLRADRIGAYGYKARPTTPVIDALAEESVLFENAITAAPWTTPAHLSLFTSLYPSSHGVRVSFEEFAWGLEFGTRGYYRLAASHITLAEVLAAERLATAAFTGGGAVDPVVGFGRGFDLYRTSMFKMDEASFGEMLSWIAANDQRQFFLFWHNYEIHAPYLHPDFAHEVAPQDQARAISDRTRAIADLSIDSPSSGVEAMSRQRDTLRQQHAFNRAVCEALYTGGVRSADRWLGRLIDWLRRRNLYDRTILVVTSDHGEEFGDHRRGRWYNEHGHSMYEEMIRVPLLIKLPGGHAGGTRVRTVVETVDVMPTVLDLLRLAPKKNEMQGRSLAPLWVPGARPDEGRAAFVESSKGRGEKKCIRTRQYKYIVRVDEATVKALGQKSLPPGPLSSELYDLRVDPHERSDLLKSDATPAARSIAAELEQRLRRHLAERPGETEPTQLSPAVIDRLRNLGYIGRAPGKPSR